MNDTFRRSVVTTASLFLLTVPAFAQNNPSSVPAEDPVIEQERDLIERTVVKVIQEGGKARVAKLTAAPVFRYGDEVQKIGDSTIWVWTD